MKVEPLKNKVMMSDITNSVQCFSYLDIKLAIGWLKEQIMPNQKIKNLSQWQIIDLIDEAFPDIINTKNKKKCK